MKKFCRKISILIALFLLVNLIVPITNSSAEAEEKAEVIVVYKDGVSTEEKKLSLFNSEAEEIEYLKELPMAIVKIPVDEVGNLKKDSNIKAVSFNKKLELFEQTPLSSRYYDRPLLDEQYINLELVNIYDAWDKGYTGKGVKIAIIDSGIANNPDLKIAGGKSFIPNKDYTVDDKGHGTFVAGIISALRNGKGTAGVAPDAQIYSLKVFDTGNYASYSDVIKAIDWSIANGMNVINLSLGGYYDDKALKTAVQKAANKGILIVAASGNDSREVAYPAAYKEVIAVGSVNNNKKKSYFSNYGAELDLVAPGEDIVSIYLKGSNGLGMGDGTSFSAPHVTGLLAVLKQRYPKYTSAQLRNYITSSAEDLGKKGRDDEFGYGLARYADQTLSKITASNVKIKNNYGKDDVIEFKGLEVGKLYSLYKDANYQKKIASFTADKLEKTISVKQLSGEKGSIYVTIKQPGLAEGVPVKVDYDAEKIAAIPAKNVTVKNNYKADDKITFKGITKGFTYTIYSDKKLKKKLKSFTAKGTKETVSVKQVGTKKGSIYIVVSKKGYYSSSVTKVNFKAESTPKISTKNITIINKKKGDTIKFSGLKKGAKVIIYKDAKKKKKIASFTAKSSKKTVKVKQLGKKAGKIYITVQWPGYNVSAVTVKSFPKEK